MDQPTRADLEDAARRFFDQLRAGLDQPRHFHQDFMELEVAQSQEAARDKVADFDAELVRNTFGHASIVSADEMLAEAGITPQDLDPQSLLVARQLAARALRAQWQLYLHQLGSPAGKFHNDDPLFDEMPAPGVIPSSPSLPSRAMLPGQTLGDTIKDYLAKKRPSVGVSQHAEVARALGWLIEVLGEKVPLSLVTKATLRDFRDDLPRIDTSLRGRKLPFRERLTNVPGNQIKSQTYLRYWNSVQAFFRWCESEGLRDDDPAATLILAARREDVAHSPEAFSEAELRKLFGTPLFAGYKPPKKYDVFGDCHERGGRWWFLVLALHTGMRAGEISQLLPEDFVFDHDVPHVKVREENASGARVKQAKTAAAIRDLPLHPNLLELGLKAFVRARRKRNPKGRVFETFRLGTGDKISEGATRFWSSYLRTFGLHKPGRSTHVFRHTVAAALRNAGVGDDDIGAILGHAGKTVTAGYGGGQSLARKEKTLALLDYGFDVVATLSPNGLTT